ncbi:uncharacterized protein B0T15DRAFT_255070 [Chaetomium strumarium]|uniref:Indole-diterpene biosynthesis protein n=1 Tax=Chaetomium strumarium TaxID=1170767 RepID=A0AAJ0M0Z3_9PEZI|nr:hypothetical protein B0T15DRAFT_255070 [Chaetomium strumarium]
MASNAATGTPASPFASMTKLSPSVYIYRPATAPSRSSPDETTTSLQKPAPKLILLATWMGARDPYIAKYLARYQALYPASAILLLRSEPRHFIRPRGMPCEIAPAVPFFRTFFPADDLSLQRDGSGSHSTANNPQPGPELLIHAFSNGGAASLHALRRALGGGDGHNTTPAPPPPPLPRYTLLLDSTPGTFRYRAAYRAFTAGLKAPFLWLVAPFVHLIVMMYWVQHMLIGRGRSGPLYVVARGLNGPAARRSEVRRTYVYGPADRLVDWRDVEAHAREAAEEGFRVRRERFDGSEHVAHVRLDGERYWRVVRETWEGVDE